MSKTNKTYVIAFLVGVLVVMSIAYAAFSTALSISSTASINSSWDVHYTRTATTGTGTAGISGGTTPTGTITYSPSSGAATSATLAANLYQPGDKVVFTLTIENGGSLKAAMSAPSITGQTGCTVSGSTCTSTSGNIKFTVGSLSRSTLDASTGTNKTATLAVTAEFVSRTVPSVTSGESASITVTFTATQSTT